MQIKKVFFKELEVKVLEEVYEPKEDSFLIANVLEKQELNGKKVLDLGTGCGMLAIIAAKQGAKVIAADVNEKALENTSENALKLKLEKAIEARQSNLFEKIPEKFNAVVFNPPYVISERIEDIAIDGGMEGRKVIERFLQEAGKHLLEKGYCLMVCSSQNKFEKIEELLREKSFEFEIAESKELFFEELRVYKFWKSTE